MELAVSTLFCLHKDWEEALPDLLSSSTRLIEVTDDGPHALNQPRVERLLELKSSYDLEYSVHAPFADANIAAPDPFIREAILRRLESSIRWASALEVESFVFHPGATTPIEHFSPGAAWRKNMESVDRLLRFARDYGVPAMIENVPEPIPFLMKSAEDFDRFFSEVKHDVSMVLDVAHANLRGETAEFLRRFGDRVRHIHVSDNRGRTDEHLPLGVGSINWKETVSAIKSTRFDGWIVIESFSGVEESLQLMAGLLANA
jgi:sugar phosphate isomerase/epimerase